MTIGALIATRNIRMLTDQNRNLLTALFNGKLQRFEGGWILFREPVGERGGVYKLRIQLDRDRAARQLFTQFLIIPLNPGESVLQRPHSARSHAWHGSIVVR